MVKCVAMPHILARVVCKAHAKGDAAVRRHWQGVSPERCDRLTIYLDDVAVIDVNVKRMRVGVQAI